MAQHDYVIANGSGAVVRSDINSALAAIASTNKGPTAPSAPTAGMIWVDDNTPSASIWTINMYDGSSWIRLGVIDTTADVFAVVPEAWTDLASAGTTDLGAVNAANLRITGTTTITAFGTAPSGTRRQLRFAGVLTLTHNATSLILPGGANLSTVAGDTAVAISLGSGNWVVVDYTRVGGGSGYIQIQRQTVSAVSAVDFTLPSGFRRFRVEIDRGRVATAGEFLAMRCGVGASFDSGGTDYGQGLLTQTNLAFVGLSQSQSSINLSGPLLSNDTRSSIEVVIDPGSASDAFQALIHAGILENTLPSFRYFAAYATRNANGAKDAIRFLSSGGANVSGTFTLFGVPT